MPLSNVMPPQKLLCVVRHASMASRRELNLCLHLSSELISSFCSSRLRTLMLDCQQRHSVADAPPNMVTSPQGRSTSAKGIPAPAKSNCWFHQETLRFFSPISDSHLRLRNTLLSRSVLIHPPGRFRVLISMAYSKFALNESDSDSDWDDSSSESSNDSDKSDDSDGDVFKIRRGVRQTTLFPD